MLYAHQYGMKVSGDCNTKFLEKMGADESNLSIFNEMGIDSIRMDLCYFDERDTKLINNAIPVKFLKYCATSSLLPSIENILVNTFVKP